MVVCKAAIPDIGLTEILARYPTFTHYPDHQQCSVALEVRCTCQRPLTVPVVTSMGASKLRCRYPAEMDIFLVHLVEGFELRPKLTFISSIAIRVRSFVGYEFFRD